MAFATISKRELNEYYEDLEFRRTLDPIEHSVIENHYYRLGVVDNKTSALLQYDGIVLATLAILLTAEYENVRVNTGYEVALFFVSLTFCLLSTLTLLGSINLRWRVVCSRTPLEDLHDSLIRSTIKRTKIYIRALWLSRISGLFLAVLFYLILFRSGLIQDMISSMTNALVDFESIARAKMDS